MKRIGELIKWTLFLTIGTNMAFMPFSPSKAPPTDGLRTLIASQNDPGLLAAYDAGFVLSSDQSRSIDDVTVTLKWMTADAVRINIGYTVDLPSEGMTATMMPALPGGTTLSDGSGNTYRPSFNVSTPISPDQPNLYNEDFDTLPSVNIPENLDLTLALKFQVAQASDSTNGGGKVYGPFLFTFSLPYSGGYRVTTLGQVTQHKIEVDLQRLVFAPSQSFISYCIQLPRSFGSDYIWDVKFNFVHDGKAVEAAARGGGGGGGGGDDPLPPTITECNSASFYLATTEFSGQWTLSANEVLGTKQSPLPDRLQARQQKGETFDSLKPDLIRAGYLKSIKGNWKFDFTLPAA